MGTEAKRFKVWITKHALTKGIFEVEAEESGDDSMIWVLGRGGHYWDYYHGNEWHRDEASARARANAMVAARIKSLERQLAGLRGKAF